MPESTVGDCSIVQNLPSLEQYYHGYIDRAEAEKRLQSFGISNSYLLRLSRADHGSDTWEDIYVLSYLSSALACFHFRLIPRFNCFQLGGRFFDSIDGCLSRYYTRDIMTGERLKHPIPPTSLPIEYHTQRLRAVQDFEPENAYDRLGCAVDDRFLLIYEDPNSDWLLATSLKSRHSGYLPKSCVEKEYPEIIERLEFFHPDPTPHPKELLKKAGPFSYLLRPCDSRPGLYTLLLFDGIRVRKCRLELVIQSELISLEDLTPTNKTTQDCSKERKNSGPSNVHTKEFNDESLPFNHNENCKLDSPRSKSDETFSRNKNVLEDNHYSQSELLTNESVNFKKVFQSPLYKTTTKILYSGTTFASVEAVVAAIESHYSDLCHAQELNAINISDDGCICSIDTESNNNNIHSVNDASSGYNHIHLNDLSLSDNSNIHTIHVFKPLCRKRKPQSCPPSSTIYMDMCYARQPPAPHQSVTEIHGELSVWLQQRKKWKSYYAHLDRKQSILTLIDGEKRKPERFDLSKCDFFPIHYTVYEKRFCFGLVLYGASTGDREEFVLSVDAPNKFHSHFINSTMSNRMNLFSTYDLDVISYSGRPEEPAYLLQNLSNPSCRLSCDWAAHPNLTSVDNKSFLSSSVNPITSSNLSDNSNVNCDLPPATWEIVYQRWMTSLKRHCRNTKADSETEDSVSLRQTHLRCYRNLEIKFNNAKLIPNSSSKSRRDEMVYSVNLDGFEIARAYSGSSAVSIFLDEFPYGFKKIEVLMKEDKRKRSIAIDFDIIQHNVNNTSHCEAINVNGSMIADRDKNLSSCRPSSSSLSSSSSTLNYSICNTQERSNGQISIVYKELYVIPFQFYESFRQTIRNYMNSEFIPLCIHVWKSFAHDMNQLNFVSSLLLTTIELNCHLELIVNLLRIEVNNNRPSSSFRGSSLGAQMLDIYSTAVCSVWRSQCFRRVYEKALEGPSTLTHSGHSITSSNPFLNSSQSNNNYCYTKSTFNQRYGPEKSSHHGTISANLHHSLTTRPYSLSTSATCSGKFDQFSSATSTQGPLQNHHTREQDWHHHLLSIAVDDLITYVRSFPLQIRWIYSELQVKFKNTFIHCRYL
ncbi:Ras GTPase-activating protein [Schistosoma japonicum]|uniref:Ras GTPase-activating protein n=2 Tax=Schistosoma japonicum TaxID=6182 RepID=A0A4Z2CQV0_SCHJA|nr:Ras GTPase-activating protein [Schistosoma japonicum]